MQLYISWSDQRRSHTARHHWYKPVQKAKELIRGAMARNASTTKKITVVLGRSGDLTLKCSALCQPPKVSWRSRTYDSKKNSPVQHKRFATQQICLKSFGNVKKLGTTAVGTSGSRRTSANNKTSLRWQQSYSREHEYGDSVFTKPVDSSNESRSSQWFYRLCHASTALSQEAGPYGTTRDAPCDLYTAKGEVSDRNRWSSMVVLTWKGGE